MFLDSEFKFWKLLNDLEKWQKSWRYEPQWQKYFQFLKFNYLMLFIKCTTIKVKLTENILCR